MKKLIFYFKIISGYFFFSAITVFTMETDTMWTKRYDNAGYEHFKSVKQTSDSGFICIGSSTNFVSLQQKLWVVKTNKNGEVIWHVNYGPKSSSVLGTDIIELNNGYYCVGYYNEQVDYYSKRYPMLLKLDLNGKSLWKREYGYLLKNIIVQDAWAIIKTKDNNLMMLADYSYYTSSIFDANIRLLKLNLDGDTLWTRSYDLGFLHSETPKSIIETSDSGFIVVGHIQTPFASPWEDLFIMKVDKKGNMLWNKIYGGDGFDEGTDVLQHSDGGFLIVGTFGKDFENYEQNSDLWLLKTDGNGDTLWTRTYGGDSDEWAESFDFTEDSGYIITGAKRNFSVSFWMDVWVVRTDSHGDMIWTKTFGLPGDDAGYSVQKTFDNGYIIGGLLTSYESSQDGYLIKIAPENPTSVKEENSEILFDQFKLFQNYPNPFNPTTKIKYEIPNAFSNHFIQLKVYDVLGKEIATLVNENKSAGEYEATFDASELNSGVYFYQLKADNYIKTKKMILLR